jgi:tRNA A37 threonylcarbamoyladenosine biosynthesis protein TsaE
VVEWAEYLRDVEPDVVIEFETVDENRRRVRIRGIDF